MFWAPHILYVITSPFPAAIGAGTLENSEPLRVGQVSGPILSGCCLPNIAQLQLVKIHCH